MARTNTATGGGTPFDGVTVDGVTIIGNGLNTPLSAVFNQTGKELLSGGAVWSGTGYVYNVSALSYFFDGIYSSTATTVTFATPDPTYDRIDAIVVNQAGTVSIIEGTASVNPIEPVIPDTELPVQYEFIVHNTTTPTVTTEGIYIDYPTTNWATSNVTLSGTPLGTTNFAATNSPYQGTTCIDNLRDGRVADLFTRTSPLSLSPFAVMSLWVRLGTATTGAYASKALYLNFQNASGQNVGSTVNAFSYGVNRLTIGTWQLCVIPVSVFGSITQSIDKLRVYMAGGSNGSLVEWDLDYILLTSGSAPVSNVPTLTFEQDGTTIAAQSTVDFLNTNNASIPVTVVNDAVNNRVKITVGSSSFYFDPSNNTFQAGANTGSNAFISQTPGGTTIQADTFTLNNISGGNYMEVTSSGINSSVFIGNLSGTNTLYFDGGTGLTRLSGVPTYANDAAATTAGLASGNLYKTTTLGITSLNIVP